MRAPIFLGKNSHITNRSLMQSNPGTAGTFRKVNMWTRVTGRKAVEAKYDYDNLMVSPRKESVS